MTAIYHPGVVLVVPKYDLGQPNNAANVMAFQTAASGLTVAQLTIVQTAVNTSWGTNWASMASGMNRYMGCWVIDMASATGNQVTNATFTPVTGSSGTQSVSDQVAALISLRAATRYRGGHGRIYVPGLAQTYIQADGHQLTSTGVNVVTTCWTSLTTAMVGVSGTAGGPYNPIIWHKKLSSAPNTVELVTGFVVQPVTATQRRRQRKVSRHRRR